jgi:hypothetical protein
MDNIKDIACVHKLHIIVRHITVRADVSCHVVWRGSAGDLLLGLQFRIPPGAWMSVS